MSSLRSSQGFSNVGLESLRFKGVTAGGILGVSPQGVASVTTAPTLDSLTVTGDVVLSGAVGMGNLTTSTMTASQATVSNGTFQNINVQGTALINNLIKINQQETLAVEQLLVGGLTFTGLNPNINLAVQGGGLDISGGNLVLEGNYTAYLPTVETSAITPSDTFSNEIQMGSANLTAVNTVAVDTAIAVGAGTDSVVIATDGVTVGGLRINGGLENTITGVETLTVNTINYNTIQTTDPTASIMTSQINAIGTGSTITIELGSQDFPLIVSNASSSLGIYPDVSPTVATQNGLLAANDAWVSFPNQGLVIGPSGAGAAGLQVANDGDVTVGGSLSVKTTGGTGVMFVESSTGSVGINNDNPQATLDVTGTVRATASANNYLLVGTDNADIKFFNNDAPGVTAARIVSQGQSLFVESSTATQYTPIGGGVPALYVNHTANQVGINKVPTTYTLDVDGDANISAGLYLYGSHPNTGIILDIFDDANYDMQVHYRGTVYNPYMYFEIDDAIPTCQGLRISNIGDSSIIATFANKQANSAEETRVGVGLHNPLAKLHVAWSDNQPIEDWLFSSTLNGGGTGGLTSQVYDIWGYWASMIGKGMQVNNTGAVTVYGDGGGAAYGSAISISSSGIDFLSTYTTSTGGAPITTSFEDAFKMRITPNGNVGIGITSPQTSLDVSGSFNVAGATFHVGGSTSQFYPVLFETMPSWYAGRYTLNIARSPTDDTAYEWPGSGPWISTFNFTATGHNTSGGNGADWYRWDYVQNPTAVYDSFLGGYDQVRATTRVVAWLRGNLTYNWSGMGVTPFDLNATGVTLYDAGLTYEPTTNNAGFTSFSNSYEFVSPYNSPIPTIQKQYGNPVTLGVWGDLSVIDTSTPNFTIATMNNGYVSAGFTSSCPGGNIQTARMSVNDYIGLNATYIGGSTFGLYGDAAQETTGLNEGLVIWNAGGVGHPSIQTVTSAGNTAALTFDATNRLIGVFNSSPQSTLDVKGTARISVSTSPTDYLLFGTDYADIQFFNNSATGTAARLVSQGNSLFVESSTATQFTQIGGSTAALYVDHLTNQVGINNNTPQYTLDVAGKVVVRGNSVLGNIDPNEGAFLSIEAFNNNNTQKLPVCLAAYGGNVGVYTTSPDPNYNLTVNGPLLVGSNTGSTEFGTGYALDVEGAVYIAGGMTLHGHLNNVVGQLTFDSNVFITGSNGITATFGVFNTVTTNSFLPVISNKIVGQPFYPFMMISSSPYSISVPSPNISFEEDGLNDASYNAYSSYGIDLENGTYTTPINGLYHFEFNMNYIQQYNITIILYVGGNELVISEGENVTSSSGSITTYVPAGTDVFLDASLDSGSQINLQVATFSGYCIASLP